MEREKNANNVDDNNDEDDDDGNDRGMLIMLVSHRSFTIMLYKMSSMGLEDLLRKRWDYQYVMIKAYGRMRGNCLVPPDHPTLDAWSWTQRGYSVSFVDVGGSALLSTCSNPIITI